MPLVKILKNYDNTERWQAGDIVDCTNPIQLIKEGKAVLLNEKGEEVPAPGTPMKCPICFYEGKDPIDLATHILAKHSGKPTLPPKTTDALRQQRLDNLEKARAARKLNQLKANVKKHEKEVEEAKRVAVEATKG